MDTAFKKDTAGCAMGKGFICIKAVLKYRHGSFPQSKLSRELAKQAVITKCCGYIYAEPSRVFIKNKAVDFRAPKNNLCKSVIICGQKRSPWKKKISVDEIRDMITRNKSQ